MNKPTENSKTTEAALFIDPLFKLNVIGITFVYKRAAKSNLFEMRIPQARDPEDPKKEVESNGHSFRITIKTTTVAGGKTTLKTRELVLPIGVIINITHTDSVREESFNPLNLLKMNDINLHPKMKFKSDDVLKRISSLLTIEDAKFMSAGDELKFNKLKINDIPPSATLPDGVRRGKKEIVEILDKIKPEITGAVAFPENPEKAATKIRITNFADNPFDIDLQYSKDFNNVTIRHTVEINNLCNSGEIDCLSKSDFLEYYEMIDRESIKNAAGEVTEFDFTLAVIKGDRAPCNVVCSDNGYDPVT